MEFKNRVPEFPGRVRLIKDASCTETEQYVIVPDEGRTTGTVNGVALNPGVELNASTFNGFQNEMKQYTDNAIDGSGGFNFNTDRFAVGQGASAESVNTFAIGSYASVTGVDSTAIGTNSRVSGNYGFAAAGGKVGDNHNYGRAENSMAIGLNAITLGYAQYAAAIGGNAKTGWSANYALAVGFGANASTPNSVAIGPFSSTAASGAVAIGMCARATINYAIQLGGTTGAVYAYQYITTSDERDKTDFQNISRSLEFLSNINGQLYRLNPRDRYLLSEETLSPQQQENVKNFGNFYYDKEAHAAKTQSGKRMRAGVTAQQVLAALEKVYGSAEYASLVNDNTVELIKSGKILPQDMESRYSVCYDSFIPFLISAITELKEKFEDIEREVRQIKGRLL